MHNMKNYKRKNCIKSYNLNNIKGEKKNISLYESNTKLHVGLVWHRRSTNQIRKTKLGAYIYQFKINLIK